MTTARDIFAGFFEASTMKDNQGAFRREPSRIRRVIGGAVFGIFLAAAFVLMAERVYLMKGSSYPRFLATDLDADGMLTIAELRKKDCKNQVVEIHEKKDGTWILRCGFSWIEGHTYISGTDPFRDFKEARAQ